MAEHRIGELARRGERLVAVAELLAEEMIDGGEHLGPRAVVPRERQPQRSALPALPEDRDVGVAKAVDRLELVADEEHVGRDAAPSRSRSTMSHCSRFVSWNSSTMIARKRSCSASRTSAWSRSRSRAKSCRSSKSSDDSRAFAAAYSAAKRSSSSCSSSLSRAASSSKAAWLSRSRARRKSAVRSPAGSEMREIEQLLRARPERQRRVRRRELLVGHVRVGCQRLRGRVQVGQALGDAGLLAELELHDRARPSGASRRHRSACGAAPGRRRSRAAAGAPSRGSSRSRRVHARTPRRGSRRRARRRARGSAGRSPPRTGAPAADASRTRESSRSTPRRAFGRGRGGRARAAPPGCARAARRPPCGCT